MAKNQVTVTFAGDAKQLSRTFSSIRGDADKLDRDWSGISGRIGTSFGSLAKKAALLGTALAGAVGAGVFAGGKALLGMADDASDLNEAMSKVDTVFGDNADTIHTWAKGAANAMGVSMKDAEDAAGGFGNLFTQLGLGSDLAVDMSQSMVGLAADFASFHNADITDVLEAQSAAFRGEYDSLQRFVPLINAAMVEQKAMEITGKANKDAITEADKALAVYALTMDGAGDAMGDFSRTSDGAANQTRITEANIANMRAEIGQRMLPITQKLTEWKLKLASALTEKLGPAIDKVTGWFNDNKETFTAVATVITETVIPAVQTFAGELGGKIMEVWGWFEDNKETFKDIGNAIADTVVPAVTDLWNVLSDIFDKEDVLNGIVTLLGVGLVGAMVAVAAVAAALATSIAIVGGVITGLGWIVTNVVDPFVRSWDNIWRVTQTVWGDITRWITGKLTMISGAFTTFKGEVSRIWNSIANAIRNPVETAIKGLQRLWNTFTGALKIPSIGGISGFTSKLHIPGLAAGGIVPASPGGSIVRISEGGEDEAVVPLSKLGSMAGGRGGETVLRIESDGSRIGDGLAELLRRTVRAQGGSVQAVLG